MRDSRFARRDDFAVRDEEGFNRLKTINPVLQSRVEDISVVDEGARGHGRMVVQKLKWLEFFQGTILFDSILYKSMYASKCVFPIIC